MPQNLTARTKAAAQWWLLVLLALACNVAIAAAAADRVGEVTFVQSVATATQPGQGPRFLQKGEPLLEGDTITTGAKGFAVIEFKDGTKITLAPNTTFVVEKLRHGAGEEAGLFKLVKGGMRTLTGLTARRNPDAVQFTTQTATIGIRGTQFDARVCGKDCIEDEKTARGQGTSAQELIVARAAVVSGKATAVSSSKDASARTLEKGSPLYNGDTVRTEKGSYAVLAFRDQTKVTVSADSQFKLDDVRFSGADSDSGNFAVSVVRGGMRALTGLLAKKEPKSVTVRSDTATIGIRGTGMDIAQAEFCFSPGDCAPALLAFTWEGGPLEFQVGDQTIVVPNGQTAVFVPGRNFFALAGNLNLPEPRPDQVDVKHQELFGADVVGEGPYVAVVDGKVVFCAVGGECVEVTPGEAFQQRPGTDRPVRIQFPVQRVPPPWGFDVRAFRVLEQLNPGDLICEIR